MMSDAYWKQPLTWNRKAEAAGKPARVFCSSFADVFEDHPVLETERARLWPLIEATPWLRWLLLTKRPQNIASMVPRRWHDMGGWPFNVWLGATAENQHRLEQRMPHLLQHPARVHFVSCEPLLGPLDLAPWLADWIDEHLPWQGPPCVRWVIAGGESGHNARPSHPDWYRSLRDQCQAARVPFLFKQWGELPPTWALEPDQMRAMLKKPSRRLWVLSNGEAYEPPRGGLPPRDAEQLWKIGKKAAGRVLDGRVWDEVPPL